MKLKKQLLILISALYITCSAHSKIILWDLGNVLFSSSKIAMSRHVGWWDCLKYAICDFRNPAGLRQKFYQVLHTAREKEERNATICSEPGKFMPNIMCEYQAGVINSDQLRKEIAATLDKLEKRDDIIDQLNERCSDLPFEKFFSSPRERRLIERIMETAFNPAIFASFTQAINAGVQLLQKCAAKKTAAEQPAHEMMVLSNWDAESFQKIKESEVGKPVFKHFKDENIYVSGFFNDMRRLKPHENAFLKIIYQTGKRPSDFVFIDDQEHNVEMAKKCGMDAILVNNGDFATVEAELKKRGLI